MHPDATPFPPPGTDLGSFEVDISADANDRYWAGAGIEHPARAAGLLYPPMAVNLTILLVQQTVTESLLHTWGRLECHARAQAPAHLTVTGAVAERFEKRERDYFVVTSEVRGARGELLWTAETELAASRRRPGAAESGGPTRPDYEVVDDGPTTTRRLTLSADLLRTYSRSGNFHSDDDAARRMGLPGMVAMGMQTLGPVCGILLDEWGDVALDGGVFEARFIGLVLEDDTVEGSVTKADDGAIFEIRNVTKSLTTAAGRVARG